MARPAIRVLLPLAALGVATLTVTWVAPSAQAVTAHASLSLTPSGGGPGDPIIADFLLSTRSAFGCAGTVEFTWDGALVGSGQLAPGAFKGCDSELEFPVPGGAADGTHVVTATVLSATTYGAASADFVVGGGAVTTSPPPVQPPTSQPTTGFTPTTTDTTTTTDPPTTTTSWTPPPFTTAAQHPISMPTTQDIKAAAADIPPAKMTVRAAAFEFGVFVFLVLCGLVTYAAVHISQGRRTRR